MIKSFLYLGLCSLMLTGSLLASDESALAASSSSTEATTPIATIDAKGRSATLMVENSLLQRTTYTSFLAENERTDQKPVSLVSTEDPLLGRPSYLQKHATLNTYFNLLRFNQNDDEDEYLIRCKNLNNADLVDCLQVNDDLSGPETLTAACSHLIVKRGIEKEQPEHIQDIVSLYAKKADFNKIDQTALAYRYAGQTKIVDLSKTKTAKCKKTDNPHLGVTSINLSNNNLGTPCIETLTASFPHAWHFDLSHNNIQGIKPYAFNSLPEGSYVDLSGNRLQDDGVDEDAFAVRRCTFNLSNTNLSSAKRTAITAAATTPNCIERLRNYCWQSTQNGMEVIFDDNPQAKLRTALAFEVAAAALIIYRSFLPFYTMSTKDNAVLTLNLHDIYQLARTTATEFNDRLYHVPIPPHRLIAVRDCMSVATINIINIITSKNRTACLLHITPSLMKDSIETYGMYYHGNDYKKRILTRYSAALAQQLLSAYLNGGSLINTTAKSLIWTSLSEISAFLLKQAISKGYDIKKWLAKPFIPSIIECNEQPGENNEK